MACKDSTTEELRRLMQRSLPAASLNENMQSLSAVTEGETILFHENYAIRAEETHINDAARCLVMQSNNDSAVIGVFMVFTMFVKLSN